MMNKLCVVLTVLLITSGCATIKTASHFTADSPKFYSGARLDIHASSNDESMLRVYKEKYDVEPPEYPRIDLPFSFLFDTFILIPVVLPVALYQAVFD